MKKKSNEVKKKKTEMQLSSVTYVGEHFCDVAVAKDPGAGIWLFG